MAIVVGGAGPSAFMGYTSDDGETYEIKTTMQNINALTVSAVTQGTYPPLPKGYHVRHIWGTSGVSPNKKRTKIPYPTVTNDWVLYAPSTFTKFGNAYTATSRIGERRLVV